MDGVLSQLRPLAAGGSRLAARVRALLEGIGERPPTAQAEKFSLWAVSGLSRSRRSVHIVILLKIHVPNINTACLRAAAVNSACSSCALAA